MRPSSGARSRWTATAPSIERQGRRKDAIGKGCTVFPGTRIQDSTIGNEVTVKDCSVIEQSTVSGQCFRGAFAHLGPVPLSAPGPGSATFVEIKKSSIGEGSKANHLAYIGDAPSEKT